MMEGENAARSQILSWHLGRNLLTISREASFAEAFFLDNEFRMENTTDDYLWEKKMSRRRTWQPSVRNRSTVRAALTVSSMAGVPSAASRVQCAVGC